MQVLNNTVRLPSKVRDSDLHAQGMYLLNELELGQREFISLEDRERWLVLYAATAEMVENGLPISTLEMFGRIATDLIAASTRMLDIAAAVEGGVAESLPPDDREMIEAIAPMFWQVLDHFKQLIDAINELLSNPRIRA